jgi:hypothetical protein
LPVLTNDYDFWIHGEDIAAFNDAVASFDLFPSRTPEEARWAGRYVLLEAPCRASFTVLERGRRLE